MRVTRHDARQHTAAYSFGQRKAARYCTTGIILNNYAVASIPAFIQPVKRFLQLNYASRHQPFGQHFRASPTITARASKSAGSLGLIPIACVTVFWRGCAAQWGAHLMT
jgi:hypothetical protein